MKTAIPTLATVLMGCTAVGGNDATTSDGTSQWTEFSHFVAIPAVAIADWAEAGQWPDRERMNELVDAAQIDMQLCAIDVSESAPKGFRIEYAVMDSSNRCSNLFIAMARRTSEAEQCFQYSVSSMESSAYNLGGEIEVSAVCGSDYSSVGIDLTGYVLSVLSERGIPEKQLRDAVRVSRVMRWPLMFELIKISIECIALPPNNSMELTGRNRHTLCKEKSKGCADFALQLMHGR